jgi:hypothetical protein
MLSIVPVIVIGTLFSSDIERSHREQFIMNEAINNVFFEDSCSYGFVCEDGRISLDGHKIYIRKSSSLFKSKKDGSSDNALGDGAGEINDGVLDELYKKLEKATEVNTGE